MPEELTAARDWVSQMKKQFSEEDVVFGALTSGWMACRTPRRSFFVTGVYHDELQHGLTFPGMRSMMVMHSRMVGRRLEIEASGGKSPHMLLVKAGKEGGGFQL